MKRMEIVIEKILDSCDLDTMGMMRIYFESENLNKTTPLLALETD